MENQNKNLPQTILKVAWMAVLLGLGMEIIILIVEAGFGKSPAVKVVIADLVQKVSWATFVCVGVAAGITAGKMRPPIVGLAGFIAAPIAFNVAKVFHKSASQALDIAGPVAGAVSPLTLALIKAVEYAVLGFVLTQMAKTEILSFKKFALVGLIVGVVFGGGIIALTLIKSANPVPAMAIATRAVNEIIFPVGCSFVLFAANAFGKRLKTS